MLLNRNTIFPAAVTAKPIQYALGALRRDFDRIFAATAAPGGRLLLTINHTLAAEQYTLTAGTDTLLLSASDDLGFVYLRSAATSWGFSRSGSGTTSRLKCGKA